jgi:hypothetical protein
MKSNNYLLYVIDSIDILVDLEKIKVMKDCLALRNIHEFKVFPSLSTFLGFNYIAW